MPKCILCTKHDSDDSKDGIPIHKDCWYNWLAVTHEGDVEKAIQSLHDILQQMRIIRAKTLNRHKDINILDF